MHRRIRQKLAVARTILWIAIKSAPTIGDRLGNRREVRLNSPQIALKPLFQYRTELSRGLLYTPSSTGSSSEWN